MRTNIDIDDQLIGDVMSVLDVRTKREAVDTALRETLRMRLQALQIRAMRGKIVFEGDVNEMRQD